MFQITVESRFSAAHAIRIGGPSGTLEPLHGHDWHVTATIAGDSLDHDGLLCDFHTIEDALREITDRFHNRSLNETDPFRIALAGDAGANALNPSAENVALHIARELSAAIDASLAPNARLVSIRVTEAPGCAVTYFLPNARGTGSR